jgi:hypothetical protein
MSTPFLAATFALALLGPPMSQPAQDAAVAWLQLVDQGRYAASWENAASFFRQTISRADWELALRSERMPLGPFRKRVLRSVTFTKNLPGAPQGEYVIIQFDTTFGNRAAALETITPMHEKDGTWKVAGYVIK